MRNLLLSMLSMSFLSLLGCGVQTKACDPIVAGELLDDYCNGTEGPINYTCDAVAMECTKLVPCTTDTECSDHFTCDLDSTASEGVCNRFCVESSQCQAGFTCDTSHRCTSGSDGGTSD